eukprot:TRINITY_DN23471_c0_g2_i1.p1 TRINITY_DN23471_c0_g2~~TRINITY_DN23471_c0_g2_i1.p1  ORF type:complete len:675 (+),score=164.94 TRINITY_DN23471_c0_g2_i1:88-2025(+)
MAMRRSVALGMLCSSMAGVARASEVGCDAGSETCHAETDAEVTLMQMKVQRHEGESSHKVSQRSGLGKAGLGVRQYVTVSHKKYKEQRLKDALRKRKAGTLSKPSCDFLEAALKNEAALEEELHTKKADMSKDKDLTEFEKESIEHSDPEKALHDDPEHVMEEDHEAAMKAIEEYMASTSPEQAAEDGTVLTPEMSEELFGLPNTPMHPAPGTENGDMSVQGDMIADSEEKKLQLLQAVKEGRRWAGDLWEDPANIQFCFASDIAESSRVAFLDAVQHYKNMVPCLGFKQVAVGDDDNRKCAKEPAIYVYSRDGGCFASVGAPWKHGGEYGRSHMNLEPNGCDTMGIAAHELGHNLGMSHEQARTDSYKHVQILWDNINPRNKYNYDIREGIDTSLPYDIMSLMHYGDSDFGLHDDNGKKLKTMKALDAEVSVMGNELGLTQMDAEQVGTMYGCLDQIKDFTLCTNDPNKCTKEDCVCHQDPSTHDEIIKTVDADGCQRCMKRCPNYNSGTTGTCGCPAGWEYGCFESGGKDYCYCKEEPQPTPAPTPAPPTPRATGVGLHGATCKADSAWYCDQFGKEDCSPSLKVNGEPILESCATMCGLCESPPPCWDITKSCGNWPECCEESCTMNGLPYKEACPHTCGLC